MEKETDIETAKMLLKGMINLNKFLLEKKPHIKEYKKIRKLHDEIRVSMYNYLDNNVDTFQGYFNNITNANYKYLKNIEIKLDRGDTYDSNIIFELFAYKTCKEIPSVTEIYLKKNKFRNEEKVKMLHSMNDSYVSLFKIIKTDFSTGIVILKDVFTNKIYEIIDISMSTSYINMDDKKPLYVYNRIIKYNDVYFCTGIPCFIDYDNKYLDYFIRDYRKNKYNDFVRCLILYDIYKKGDI